MRPPPSSATAQAVTIGRLPAETQEQAAVGSSVVISGHAWDQATPANRRSSLSGAAGASGVAASEAGGAVGELRRSQTMEATTLRSMLMATREKP